MRARWRSAVAAIGLGAVALSTASNPAAMADDTPPGGDKKVQVSGDLDVRPDRVEPTRTRQDAFARGSARRAQSATTQQTWNRFGAPGFVLAGKGEVLASGLSKDPAAAARAYLERERAAYGLTSQDVAALDVVAVNPMGEAKVVTLRQTFGGVPAGVDGLAVVAVRDGAVSFVSSTLAPTDSSATQRLAPATLTPAQAIERAATHVGATATKVTERGSAAKSREAAGGWRNFTAAGLRGDQRVKEVVVPVPGGSPRTAWHVEVSEKADQMYAVYVDAVTGEVIVREDQVDEYAPSEDPGNPRWSVFEPNPSLDLSSTDTRDVWCWTAGPGCTDVVGSAASPKAWDIDPATGAPTGTTSGNNAFTFGDWAGDAVVQQYPPTKADRTYQFPWTNAWQKGKCNPDLYSTPGGNDIDAATTHMFAMHNRLHDWAYGLGFTETAWNLQEDNYGKGGVGGDPEEGWSQYEAIPNSRNNAFQGTGADGGNVYTGMYLYQPLAATSGPIYPNCVDGTLDSTVVAHEYTHAISNRMAAGPDRGLSGAQAGAMGESWSDIVGLEFLQETGSMPLQRRLVSRAVYDNGNADHGNRTYNFDTSPLNYSNMEYDVVGASVHSNGAIWSATLNDLRTGFVDRYGLGDHAAMKACAAGTTPLTSCPGSRQWAQVVFDAWLLMANGSVSMVDARNAMLAADLVRFGGANQDILWNAFARRGLGQGAASSNSNDLAPRASFVSPHSKAATLRFSPVGEDGRPVVGATLYVGDFEAMKVGSATRRAQPVADTDPSTPLGDVVAVVPGEMRYTATAPGHGQVKQTFAAKPGQTRDLPVKFWTNLASSAAGASVTGAGVSVPSLIDGSEGTAASTVADPSAAQKVFTIDLAGGRQVVRRIQVSALTGPNTTVQRFQMLRQFEVLACDAKGVVTCTEDRDYRVVHTSSADAFPGTRPRPVPSEVLMRSFPITQTAATHLRLRVMTNQCQGGPDFQGELDLDPRTTTNCPTGYDAFADSATIGVAEFQALRK